MRCAGSERMAEDVGDRRGAAWRRTERLVERGGSGSRKNAALTLTRARPAAKKPGACGPHRVASEPTTGPTMTPAEVAAVNQPRALARCSGSTVSET